MAIKYKLVEKSTNPRDKSAPKKWYATTQSATPLSGKAMTRAATEYTTTAPIELEAALELLAKFIPKQLLQGHTISIPGLGYFRLTFKSKGADTVQQFRADQMIYDIRPVFVPDKEFRRNVREEVEFEDGGVKAGNISYATRNDYYEATGQSPEDPDDPSTGGGGGEDPLPGA